jgi:hypothetical protein
MIMPSPFGDEMDHLDTRKAYLECRDRRGPMFPIVVDVNHVSNLKPDSRYILGREDGSVASVLSSKKQPEHCNQWLLGPFINY